MPTITNYYIQVNKTVFLRQQDEKSRDKGCRCNYIPDSSKPVIRIVNLDGDDVRGLVV